MNLIEQWIALFFDRLPYTEEAAEARGKIERALQNTAPDAAPDDWKGSSRNIFGNKRRSTNWYLWRRYGYENQTVTD